MVDVVKKKIIISAVAVALYVTIYFVWSRVQAEGNLWCFYYSQMGDGCRQIDVNDADLMNNRPRYEWDNPMGREKITSLIFRPCIWLDECLGKKRYTAGPSVLN